MTERLVSSNGLCQMASTEFCRGQTDCYTCPHGKKVFKSEAAYEDTGLTPEETAEYKKFEDELVNSGKSFQHVLDLLAAERDGRCEVLPCKVGDTVWIIERNESGEAVDYCGYMFLAVSVGVAIVSAFIDNFETAEETINCHISETAEGCDTSLYVIPIEDCYLTPEEAEAALKEDKDGN